jgi:hypothetical protein
MSRDLSCGSCCASLASLSFLHLPWCYCKNLSNWFPPSRNTYDEPLHVSCPRFPLAHTQCLMYADDSTILTLNKCMPSYMKQVRASTMYKRAMNPVTGRTSRICKQTRLLWSFCAGTSYPVSNFIIFFLISSLVSTFQFMLCGEGSVRFYTLLEV